MAEESDQIVEQLQVQRERLAHNVSELESYIRRKADVRRYYNRTPWRFVAGALVAGIVLAMRTASPKVTRCR